MSQEKIRNEDIVSLDKSKVGLGSVDNTADSAKNVLSATKLTTARAINGVDFDGSEAITIYDATKVPTSTTVNGHALSGDVTITASDVGLGNVTNVAASSTADASATIVQRTAQGYVNANYFNTTADVNSNTPSHIAIQTSSDNYIRWQTPSQFKINLGINITSGTAAPSGGSSGDIYLQYT